MKEPEGEMIDVLREGAKANIDPGRLLAPTISWKTRPNFASTILQMQVVTQRPKSDEKIYANLQDLTAFDRSRPSSKRVRHINIAHEVLYIRPNTVDGEYRDPLHHELYRPEDGKHERHVMKAGAYTLPTY